jgi:hypothetical protein
MSLSVNISEIEKFGKNAINSSLEINTTGDSVETLVNLVWTL